MTPTDTAALKAELEGTLLLHWQQKHREPREVGTALTVHFVVSEAADALLPLVSRLIEAAEAKVLLEIQRARLHRFVVEPLGGTGDESDYERCILCGATARGKIQHQPTCLIARALAVSTPTRTENG